MSDNPFAVVAKPGDRVENLSTPRPIIDRMAHETNAALADPAVWQKLADLGGMKPDLTPDGLSTPQTFDAFIRSEIVKWAEVVHKGHITVD